jgi:glycosyltransferase involved in cell wall biosynthesis
MSQKKIINLSIDQKLFDDGSAVSKRFIEYGGVFKEFHAVVYMPAGFSKKQLAPNVTIYPTNSKSRFAYFFDAFKIASALIEASENREDIVISSQDAFTHLVAMKLKQKLGVKIQLQFHTDFLSPYFRKESLKNYARYLAYKKTLPYADYIRVVSKKIKNSLEDAAARNAVRYNCIPFVLPIFTDIGHFETAQLSENNKDGSDLHKRFPQFKFILLMASRLSREKNIRLAIDAIININDSTVGLVIAGAGPEEEWLKAYVEEKNLGKRVMFLGWQKDLTPLYKTADAFLLTSHYEGYGLTLVEAAACRLPIISTKVGIADEFFLDGVSILLCEQNDTQCLTSHISRLTHDETLRKALKTNAHAVVGHKLPDKAEYLELYQKSFENNYL